MHQFKHSSRLAGRWKSAVFAIALSAAFPLTAHADSILATSPSGSVFALVQDGTVGYQFDVLDSNFLVTSLGFYDRFSDGLARDHEIGIWAEAGGAPLATATVLAGTASSLDAEFRWTNLSTPLLLTANTSYVIGATVAGGDSTDAFRDTAVINSLFSVVNAAHLTTGSSLSMPVTHFNGAQGYFGPNLGGVAVPDHGSSALLMALAVLALVLRMHLQA